MKSYLALCLISLLAGCDKRVSYSYKFQQTIENKIPDNIVLSYFSKEYKDSAYHLKTVIRIMANSAWDTTFRIDDYNIFMPFGLPPAWDSVSLANDKGGYVRSYLRISCPEDDNPLCPENYAKIITKNDKRYRFVLE